MLALKAAAAAAAAIVIAVPLTACGGSKKADVVVPYLIGKDVATAEKLLESRGLRWTWGEEPCPSGDRVYSYAPYGRVPSGTVVRLDPDSAHTLVRGPRGPC